MDVVVAGSTGLIGSALRSVLEARGHRVRPLLRPSTPPAPGGIRWDPAGGTIDAPALEGADVVVCLSGESIGARRWTDRQKRAMRDSRVGAVSLLARTIASMQRKPHLFVCASASGYYGDRGNEVLDETASPGRGFLAELVREWEAAAEPAGVRTVHLRSGIVLSPRGGLLGTILPIFRFGLGGRLGDGTQWMPWITIDDEAAAIAHLIELPSAAGPYNLAAPSPATNEEFTRAFAHALRRPAFIPVPRFGLRALFGAEPTEEAFLVSQRLVPRALVESGYAFRDPEIEPALGHVLGS